MWTHLEPDSAKLEQVFEPLCARAVEFSRVWSIAELKLSEDEVAWLRRWFDCLTPETTESWFKFVLPLKAEGDTFVTYRQMFGALLMCAGAEVCREESREDSVWPVIRSILPQSHPLRQELFLSNGQPSPLAKDVIGDAVGALGLRNVMDIEGTQQWFGTIKLQFGFTYRGAKNRLAEWLVNLGRPNAVQYLDGDSEFSELTSASFQSLWRVLKQYRRGLIEEVTARRTLQHNPWIKSHWIDDLLQESRARISTLGSGFPSDPAGVPEERASAEEFCPIAGIALEWSPGASPRFRFQLDRTAIQGQIADKSNVTELDFYVDGNRVRRWLRQPDGSWGGDASIYAESNNKRERPNLSPRTFVVQTGDGTPLVDWDFVNSGLLDDVLVFDLEGRRLTKAGWEWLQPNRHYAVVCDRQCEIQGCAPVQTFERNGIARKVVRLSSPINQDLCVAYKDFILWQPIRTPSDQQPSFALVLRVPESQVLSLRDRSKLVLEGLPVDSHSVELLIHKKTHGLQWEESHWRTVKAVTISPELAARRRRVRVRFSLNGRTFTEQPRIEFNLLGAAMLRHQGEGQEQVTFAVLEAKSDVNRSEGTEYLQLWTPDGNKRAQIYEGNCRVGTLQHGKIRLIDFPGHGGKLHIRGSTGRESLEIRCHDTGCVAGFWPAMLGDAAQFRLLRDKPPADVGERGYSLFEWIVKNQREVKLVRLPNSCVQTRSTQRLWRLAYNSNPLALALTWKGSWLGAWWNLERIRDYVGKREELRLQEFAIMKWLRLPVLHPDLVASMKKAILRAPCRFIRTWLQDNGLPESLRPHEHVPGLDSVIRHFLWNDFPLAHTRDAITLLRPAESRTDQDHRAAHLNKLSDVSPILLWKGMEQFRKHHVSAAFLDLLKEFTHGQVNLPLESNHQKLQARLGSIEDRLMRTTDISKARLESITCGCIRSLQEREWRSSEQDRFDLLRLGETHSGRTYLSVRIGLYWMELARR